MKIILIITSFITLAEISNAFSDVHLTNFNEEESIKIHKAITQIETIRASEKFATMTINFTYKGIRKFVENNNLSNEEIYRLVSSHELELDLELYYSDDRTIGYTFPTTNKIWINNKYFKNFTEAQIAGNIFHEWTHKLGFNHSKFGSNIRMYTVPYALGDIMVKLCIEED